jgi:negative regulator of sigma-B (phosphoserine phosphatase)
LDLDSFPIAWGIAARPRRGEVESGDLPLVVAVPDGVLIAAIDGLGHGSEAALAARMAAETIRENADRLSIADLFVRCHRELKRTRGVVMNAAFIHGTDDALTWLGVGNIEGVLLARSAGRAASRETLLLRGGVLGYQLPPLTPRTLRLAGGDTLIFATDGIKSGFLKDVDPERSPQEIADTLLRLNGRTDDDALAIVARYTGSRHD